VGGLFVSDIRGARIFWEYFQEGKCFVSNVKQPEENYQRTRKYLRYVLKKLVGFISQPEELKIWRRRWMKKAIELLESIRKELSAGSSAKSRSVSYDYLYKALKKIDHLIAELKAPLRWETPEQYEKRNGEKWPDDWAVYCFMFDGQGWVVGDYKWAKEFHTGEIIICATEAGPPLTGGDRRRKHDRDYPLPLRSHARGGEKDTSHGIWLGNAGRRLTGCRKRNIIMLKLNQGECSVTHNRQTRRMTGLNTGHHMEEGK
jgi:hypothetical protein